MKSIAIAIPLIVPMAMTAVCSADPTATLRVTARVVRYCTAITNNDVTDCSAETLRVQSTLSGTASVMTVGGEPSIQFIGPPPTVEQERNTLHVSF
jgi:hypothetical protein